MIKVVGKRKGTISAMVTEIVKEFGLENEDITIVGKKTRHKQGYYAYAWHNFFVPLEVKNIAARQQPQNNTLQQPEQARPKAARARPAALHKKASEYKVVLHAPITTSGTSLLLWEMLRHELMHVKQFASGRLQYSCEAIVWDGKLYRNYDYWDCPWENQARMVQTQAFDVCWT